MSCKDGDDEVVDIDEGEDGHKICSKADVPITGRSSDPEDDEPSFVCGKTIELRRHCVGLSMGDCRIFSQEFQNLPRES